MLSVITFMAVALAIPPSVLPWLNTKTPGGVWWRYGAGILVSLVGTALYLLPFDGVGRSYLVLFLMIAAPFSLIASFISAWICAGKVEARAAKG